MSHPSLSVVFERTGDNQDITQEAYDSALLGDYSGVYNIVGVYTERFGNPNPVRLVGPSGPGFVVERYFDDWQWTIRDEDGQFVGRVPLGEGIAVREHDIDAIRRIKLLVDAIPRDINRVSFTRKTGELPEFFDVDVERDWHLVFQYEVGHVTYPSVHRARLNKERVRFIRSGNAYDYLIERMRQDMHRVDIEMPPLVFLVDMRDTKTAYHVTPPRRFLEQVSHLVDDVIDAARDIAIRLVDDTGVEQNEDADVGNFIGDPEDDMPDLTF